MKKPYDKSKSGLFALGKLDNVSTYLKDLRRLTDEPVDAQTLDMNITKAYFEGRDLSYCYNDEGNPVLGDFDPRRTCRYAIETGCTLSSDACQKIYACYTTDRYGNWSGVRFMTKWQLESRMNAYHFGSISFKNYAEANTFIVNLEKKLLPGEVWKFKSSSKDDYRPKTEFDILQSYLQYVFEKLLSEYQNKGSKNYNKIAFSSDGAYALFNTGLLSEFAQDVFLVGQVYSKQENGDFLLSNPSIAPGKVELMRKYNFPAEALTPYPDMVEFFHTLDEIIFDAETEIDMSPEKLSHIIKDGANRNRFPLKYKAIFDRGDLATLATTLTAAIENAKKIAKRNYKFVVPQYRSASKTEPSKIQFLMPIYLDRQYGQKPDFALVLNEEKIGSSRYYTPETILELSWAYNNARVICKPEDTWLNPASIDSAPVADEGAAEDNLEIDEYEFAVKPGADFAVTQGTQPAGETASAVEPDNIGKTGVLQNVSFRKNMKGIQGEIFGFTGTLAKAELAQSDWNFYIQNPPKVKVAGINPQGTQYILHIIE